MKTVSTIVAGTLLASLAGTDADAASKYKTNLKKLTHAYEVCVLAGAIAFSKEAASADTSNSETIVIDPGPVTAYLDEQCKEELAAFEAYLKKQGVSGKVAAATSAQLRENVYTTVGSILIANFVT